MYLSVYLSVMAANVAAFVEFACALLVFSYQACFTVVVCEKL